jgi:hypothetical protein
LKTRLDQSEDWLKGGECLACETLRVTDTPLVDQLRLEGRLDSTGIFSVDLQRARALLSQFTHTHATQHLQQLVSAAVLCGASECHIQRTRNRLRVEFDGPPARAEQVEHLFDALLLESQHGAGRWLHWLGLGFLGAVKEADEVRLASRQGANLVFRSGDFQWLNGPSVGPSTRIEIIYRRSWQRRWWPFYGKERSLDRTTLESFCFAPLRLQVEQEWMHQAFALSDNFPTVVQGAPLLPSIVPKTFGQRWNVTRRIADGEYSLAFSFGEPSLSIVVAGRLLFSEKPLRGFACSALLVFTELSLDLAGAPLESEWTRCRAILQREVELTLAAALLADEPTAWRIVRDHWLMLNQNGPVLQLELVEGANGTLLPLGALRGKRKLLVSEHYPGTTFQGRSVVRPTELLDKVLPKRKLTPLCELPAHGWVVGGSQLRLPGERYCKKHKFQRTGLVGIAGLTPSAEPSFPVLVYSEDDVPLEVQLSVPLPAGLHLAVKGAFLPGTDLDDELALLYGSLLGRPHSTTLKLFHYLEYLDYATRKFAATAALLDLDAVCAEPFLPGNIAPRNARECWPLIVEHLDTNQALKLDRFLQCRVL